MSRPLNKTQLLAAIEKEYTALEKFLAPLTAEQMAFAPAPGAWAVKDILAHRELVPRTSPRIVPPITPEDD